MTKAMQQKLRQKAFNLRVIAMKKGLTNRAIAEALGCHEDLVSKALRLKRMEAFKRVAAYIRSFKPARKAA